MFELIYPWLSSFLPPLLAYLGTLLILLVIALLLVFIIPVILGWVDRKMSARIQSRYGPVYVGKFGLLQNIADVVKLMGKRFIENRNIDRLAFDFVPIAFATTGLMIILIIPWGYSNLAILELPYNLLFLYVLLAVSPLFVLIAGWGENNKYALLGGFRGAAQIITYELSLIVVMISVALFSGSYDITKIVAAQSSAWLIEYLPVTFIVFILASLAIIERAPFDLPEASQELQAGWKIEYSGIKYGLFLLEEYVKVLAISMLAVYLFFGGWNGPVLPPFVWFWIKTVIFTFLFMSLRWVFNRVRIDQLVRFGLNVLLPLSIANLLIAGLVVTL